MRAVSARDDGNGGAIVTVADAASLSETRFRIVRGDDACLQSNGKWASNKADLLAEASRSGNDLVLQLPPVLCENTDETTYYFELTALPGEQMSVGWPAIAQPIVQRGTSIRAAAAKLPLVAPVPVLAPKPPVVPVPPTIAPVETVPTRSGPSTAVKLGGGVLLVAVVAAALLVLKPWATPPVTQAPVVPAETPPVAPPPAPAPPEPTPVPPPQAAPDPDAMSVTDLARGTPAVMLAQALKRMPTKPQDALLLLEVAGSDQHHGPALAALGKVYDPLLPRQGGIPADARQAAKAYQDASRHQDDTASAEREALHQKLVQQRDDGDTKAKLILQDFWP